MRYATPYNISNIRYTVRPYKYFLSQHRRDFGETFTATGLRLRGFLHIAPYRRDRLYGVARYRDNGSCIYVKT